MRVFQVGLFVVSVAIANEINLPCTPWIMEVTTHTATVCLQVYNSKLKDN